MILPYLLPIFLLFNTVHLQPKPLVFLTYSPNGQRLNVSFVVEQPEGNFTLENEEQSRPMSLLYGISANMEQYNGSLSGDLPQTLRMFVYGAEMEIPPNRTIEYAIIDREKGTILVEEKVVLKQEDATNLTVCVFGDYRADMMYDRAINLSAYAGANHCGLLLFIGKISWEQRACPHCNFSTVFFSTTNSTGNSTMNGGMTKDVGLTFSPYSMLDDHAGMGQTRIFGQVPSLFGAVGHNFNETSFFDCTEVDGVAFIQTTVEVSTVARLGDNHESEQFHFVEHYFRETMLMELECKLQELHRRPKRPWILVYLTHPSLINELETDVLSLKDNDRFFEILNRYKIDLLLSCGVEGMAAILKERQQNKPKEELPPYLGTTMATCLSAKDCQYLVMDVGKAQLDWRYMDGTGKRQKEGQFQKNTQSADECIPDEIPSITGLVSNGTRMATRK